MAVSRATSRAKAFARGSGGGIIPLLLQLAPRLALGQTVKAPDVVRDLNDVYVFICISFDWLFTFLIVLSIVLALVAAYRYALSAGDPEKVKSAKNTIVYAAVAVALGVVAKGMPSVIASFFTRSQVLNCGD